MFATKLEIIDTQVSCLLSLKELVTSQPELLQHHTLYHIKLPMTRLLPMVLRCLVAHCLKASSMNQSFLAQIGSSRPFLSSCQDLEVRCEKH